MLRRLAILLGLLAAVWLAWSLVRDPGRDAPRVDDEADGRTPGTAPPEATGPATAAARLGVARPDDPNPGAIRLRLVDGDTRLPLPGVSVSVGGDSAAGHRERRGGRTDEAGEALVARVPAGAAWLVRVSPPESRPLERRDVAVAEGETTDLGTLYTGAHGRIEGVVVDERGTGIPKATVAASLLPATLAADDGDAFPSRPFEGVTASTETDEHGTFVLEELPVGMVAVQASRPGFRSTVDRAVLEAAGKTANLRLLLVRGIAVLGRVEERDGRPVVGAQVELGLPPTAGEEFVAREAVETDADGGFEVAGFGSRRIDPAIRVTPKDRPPTLFPRPPSVAPFLRIVLDGGAALTIRVADDATDVPVAEATVALRPAWRSEGDGNPGPRELLATTDARGIASLPVSSGEFPDLAVRAKGWLAGTAAVRDPSFHLRLDKGGTSALREGERRSMRVWVRRGPLLHGRVTDEGGAVVPRARVHVEYATTTSRTVETDGAGEYRIPDAEVARARTVVARDPAGRHGARVAVVLPPAWEDALFLPVDLVLKDLPDAGSPAGAAGAATGEGCSVRGRTVDAGLRPLGDVLVAVRGVKPFRSDAAGAFFAKGALVVHPLDSRTPYVPALLTLDGYLPTRCDWPAREGDLLEPPDVVMGFGSSIRGRLRAKGYSVAGGSVFLEGREDVPRRATVVADDGTFEVRALAPGPARVHARGRGWVAVPAVVRAADPPTEVLLSIAPLLEWEGRVVDSGGAPLYPGKVAFDRGTREDTSIDPLSEQVEAQTGAGGTFRLATSGTPPPFLWIRRQAGAPKRVDTPAPGSGINLVLPR